MRTVDGERVIVAIHGAAFGPESVRVLGYGGVHFPVDFGQLRIVQNTTIERINQCGRIVIAVRSPEGYGCIALDGVSMPARVATSYVAKHVAYAVTGDAYENRLVAVHDPASSDTDQLCYTTGIVNRDGTLANSMYFNGVGIRPWIPRPNTSRWVTACGGFMVTAEPADRTGSRWVVDLVDMRHDDAPDGKPARKPSKKPVCDTVKHLGVWSLARAIPAVSVHGVYFAINGPLVIWCANRILIAPAHSPRMRTVQLDNAVDVQLGPGPGACILDRGGQRLSFISLRDDGDIASLDLPGGRTGLGLARTDYGACVFHSDETVGFYHRGDASGVRPHLN